MYLRWFKILNITVLGSTKGTDLQPIIDSIESSKLKDINISFVLSNKEDAIILERARKHGLKAIFLDPKGKERKEYDAEITKLCKEHDVELIVLIGYMKLMSNEFVDEWRNKVMNIHPSFLPAFAGDMDKSVHEAILEYGCKVSGCSLIFIDEGADTGPIIIQKVCQIDEGETSDSLKEKVQKLEGEAIIEALELYRDGKIEVVGRIVHIK